MPWYSVRHVGHTIALDVATARPPLAPPPRTAWTGRLRGISGVGPEGTKAGGRGGGAAAAAWTRLRRRSSSASATRPRITSARRPITAISNGSLVAASITVDGVNPDIDGGLVFRG